MDTLLPLDVARYFLKRSQEIDSKGLDPMKLNKLVFLAQGWHLGIHDESLINEDIEAWKHGPVIPSLYHKFKWYRARTIPFKKYKDIPDQLLTDKITEFLDMVWSSYKDHNAVYLSNLTHIKDSPWEKTWNLFGGHLIKGAVIDQDEMKGYYRNLYQKLEQKYQDSNVSTTG